MNTLSRRIISSLTAALALGLALASGPIPAMAGNTRIVDNDYPSSGACHGAGYATIQAAVASFLPGQSGTIKVCPGTYSENVSISGLGRIKLVAKPGTVTIAAPNTTSLITATNTTLLTVRGFTLDGASNTITSGLVAVQDSSSAFTKNVFQNSTNSTALLVNITTGARSLSVIHNHFTGLSEGVNAVVSSGALASKVMGNDLTAVGICIYIQAGASAGGSARVSGNHLQGSDTGIQIDGPTKATVSGNKLDGFDWGIALQNTTNVKVSGNRMRVSGEGIIIFSSVTNASANRVQGNTIEAIANNFVGIVINITSGPAADFNQIKGNKITDPLNLYTATTGISLSASSGSLNGTLIKGNKLTSIDVPYTHTGDTNTVISGNKCTPAAPCITP